ncbi:MULTISPECIES: magnesium/cobalt transporter CorA [Flavobacterium]|nr:MULTISPECIES: magnesium/cobalt transporter CorA [Flavobacterium]OXA77162.1 magnesium and cobalt transport protein CorA [Flavobacterium columnare NBRC 100251 = ATCC 23463]AMA48624.1 magnesium transporter [Flavobacterium covae]AND65250.1 magnesium and cobalt transport protein CorA [Flavobacterium covae]MCJ1807068.1 magnesium/cobalt transporter CorA [Flavobacterium covae]MCJ1808351.1 magnesium/cobalt transporter CorA [Flavobacterium covae]
MRKIKYKKGKKIIPTFLEYTGSYKSIPTTMQLFVYDTHTLVESADGFFEEMIVDVDLKKQNWINIHGLTDLEKIQKIGAFLNVDKFILGDILNTTKRTKIDEYHNVLFFSIKSILPIEHSDNIKVEQISFLLKEGILTSFQEKKSDFFAHIRERIRTHSGIVRDKEVDYLLYLLLDAIIENFFITIEAEEDKVEALINISKTNSKPEILEQIEKHRDNFNFLKRSIIPLRDSLYSIRTTKDDNVFNVIKKENYSFFERLHQKCLELLEQIEYDLTTLESASNFYFASQSHKMNEVMKTLTIVSVFFMPLTFIVGVYGMNFDNMPELHWKYGYFMVLVSMVILLIAMAIYFKWRKWF